MPSPVKNRNALNTPRVPANALSSEARPKIAMLPSSSGLRPKRSPIGPEESAPAMTPRLDHRKASANAGGASCQAWVSGGTAQPIEPTS
jgi:hypothetical protein